MSSASPTSTPVSQMDPAYVAENNLPWLLAITITFHIMAWIMVILRTYTRIYLVKSFGKDDAMMVMALLLVCGGGMVTLGFAGTYGWGRHIDTLSKSDQMNYTKMMLFHGIISSITAFMFLKLSIVFSLLRIQGHNTTYRNFLYGLAVFIVLYTIVGWVSWALSCYPIQGYWDKSVKAWCLAKEKFSVFSYVNTVCNILTDFMLATLPIPLIWQLNMALRSRLYLIGIFACGYLTCVLGILKVVWQFSPEHSGPDRTFTDFVRFWGFLEGNMGIMVACAPTLKKLVGSWLNLGTTQNGSSYGYGGYGPGTPAPHRSSFMPRSARDGAKAAAGNRNHTGYIKTGDDKNASDQELESHEMDKYGVGLGIGQAHSAGLNTGSDVYLGAEKNDVKVSSSWPSAGRSGSEEHILNGTIVRTTEVRIHPN